jgi:hypothetical protein
LDRYVHQALDLPYLIGLHWFEWADESPEGRFDGESCNYGLVDIHDKEYALLTQKHTALNLLAEDLHKSAALPLPGDFNPPPDAQYRQAAEGVKVPSQRNFMNISPSAPVSVWGDESHGGTVTLDLADGPLEADYVSGGGWGCGLSCYCNIPPMVSEQVVDLSGYNLMTFEVFAPLGLNFQVFLTEIHFEDLERRTSYGNQKGNQILDLQGLSTVDFFIPGGQGSGRLILRNLQFRVR